MTAIFADNWPRYKKNYPNWEIGGSSLDTHTQLQNTQVSLWNEIRGQLNTFLTKGTISKVSLSFTTPQVVE